MSEPVVCKHVCPRCHNCFEAPEAFASTYCPECFDEAYGVTQKPSGRWNLNLWAGIICVTGAIIISVWIVSR